MNGTMEVTPAARTRRRPSAKTSARNGGERVKATLILSLEASRRLSIHATMTDEDRSALVEQLILEHLRTYVVSNRSRGPEVAEGV